MRTILSRPWAGLAADAVVGAALFGATTLLCLLVNALATPLLGHFPVWVYRDALSCIALAAGLGALIGVAIDGAWMNVLTSLGRLARALARVVAMPFALARHRCYVMVVVPCLALLVMSVVPLWGAWESSESTLWKVVALLTSHVATAQNWHHLWHREGWNLILAVYIIGVGLLLAFLALWNLDCVCWLVRRISRGHGAEDPCRRRDQPRSRIRTA